MYRRLVILLGALALLPSSSALAQACIGLPSLASRPTNLLIDAQFGEGSNAFGGRFGFGSSAAFAGIGAHLIDFEDEEDAGFSLGLDAGLSLLPAPGSALTFCPVGNLVFTSLPDRRILGRDVESNTWEGAAGLAVGGAVSGGEGIGIIPFASISAVYRRLEVEVEDVDESDSDTFGRFGAGLGLLFGNSIVIRPNVTVPLGLDGADPVYGIGIAFTFGRR